MPQAASLPWFVDTALCLFGFRGARDPEAGPPPLAGRLRPARGKAWPLPRSRDDDVT